MFEVGVTAYRFLQYKSAGGSRAQVVAHVPVGGRVNGVDLSGHWLNVTPGEGTVPGTDTRALWLELKHVDMFPADIQFFSRSNVNLRPEPGGEPAWRVDLDGRYAVRDAQRYGRYDEPWYRIEVDGREGWVAGRLVNRRSYVFPGVHLIAGLYRYGRGQPDRAVAEIEAFLADVPEEDNVTRASAYKFLAASRLANERVRPRVVDAALKDIDAAAALTPFDASVYTLRSVVHAGRSQQVELALRDLQHALDLNRRDPAARRLLRDMTRASEQPSWRFLAPGREGDELKMLLKDFERTY